MADCEYCGEPLGDCSPACERSALRTAEARIAELEEALGEAAQWLRWAAVWFWKDEDHPGTDKAVNAAERAEAALTGSSDYLARRDREVRERALREAAEAVNAAREVPLHTGQVEFVNGVRRGHDRCEIAILALIEKEEPRDG